MKKITIFLWIAISIFTLTKLLNSQNDYIKNRFTFGVYNWAMRSDLRTAPNFNNYIQLNINANFSYTYRGDYHPEITYLDGFIISPSFYLPTYNETIANIFNSPSDYHKQKINLERAKVMRGALGQRSTYQAEEPGTYSDKRPGYGYMGSETGSDYTEGAVRGRECTTRADNAGYIVKILYENMEQINKINTDASKTSMDYFWSDKKDSLYFWVVKPRMEIKVTDFNDPLKKELPVVRIDVKRFDGTIINQFTIKVKDFQTSINYYDGNYKEVFYDNMTNE